jgi:molybdopterin/thiamine biosynthesis adenylyltransferase
LSKRQHFEDAVSVVADWLDCDEAKKTTRRVSHPPEGSAAAWDIDLKGDFPLITSVRLVLPAAFPAEPCFFAVAKDLELEVPHVERGGQLCLRTSPSQQDFDHPIGAVQRAFDHLLNNFLRKLGETGWRETEFHKERITYWNLHCTDPRRHTRIERQIGNVYLDATGLDRWALGDVVGLLRPNTKHARFTRQVVSLDGDPLDVAKRHRWADGTVVKGKALVVRLPSTYLWTPMHWPRSPDELEHLIRDATDGEASLRGLFDSARKLFKEHSSASKVRTSRDGRQSDKPHAAPQLHILLVQDGAVFGYQMQHVGIFTPSRFTIEPFSADRIDADWALARDSNLPELHALRAQRVLLLGAGSLGSPVAHLLARSGLGSLTIVDREMMDSENTARHLLGMPHLAAAKAPQLAEELRRLVPGANIVGVCAEATAWLEKHAHQHEFDLVVDCTAESSVRIYLAKTRDRLIAGVPIAHAWLEPLCSAAHVVLTHPDTPWPATDPTDDLVNASNLSADETRIQLPACSGGFHPYGAADVTQAAAFAAERVLQVLAEPETNSCVWSWVRSVAFFERLNLPVETRAIVPRLGGPLDVATTTRSLSEVLGQ